MMRNANASHRRRICAVAALILAANACVAQSGPDLNDISLPPGFSIEVWVDNVPDARSLALGASGTVFVSTRRDGRVYAVSNSGDERRVTTIAEGLRMPNGVAFRDGDLYVAENHRIIRFDDIEARLRDVPEPVVINDRLLPERHHGWRYIDFGPDGRLYVAIGAPCNVCERDGAANISRMNADGSGMEVFAEGVRNSVGFAWHPVSRDLWFTDNGRDMLGDDLPPEELNRAPVRGLHFGFPYCHGGDLPDPEFGDRRDCGEFEGPAQKLGPHVASLGIIFYTGSMFPGAYRNQVLIAEHGSWNRSRKIGYRVTLVRIEDDVPVSYEVFAAGWLRNEEVSGRPVDLLQLPDGSVLLSDDHNGLIYRIAYSRPIDEGVSP